jgi:TatD DNase family protein
MIDAHNHLHDARLVPHHGEILPLLAKLGVQRAVVNGTREDDWPAVAALAAEQPWVLPSFGLHPWYAPKRSAAWLDALRRQLDANPRAGVGEIGLDRWIEGHDLADQTDVFTAQLALATERNLPPTIHCIQAWGALRDILRAHPLPCRGFLLHAYGGSLEMIRDFADHGAYFSFSPYFLHARKAAQREVFAAIPEDRLLIETDAPDLRPPDERNTHPLRGAAGEPINHPANIEVAYAGLAEIRKMNVAKLAGIVAESFARLFGGKTRSAHPA